MVFQKFSGGNTPRPHSWVLLFRTSTSAVCAEELHSQFLCPTPILPKPPKQRRTPPFENSAKLPEHGPL